MTSLHRLRREQWIPRSIEGVFGFFSDPGNLEEITPPWLRSQIVRSRLISVSPGTRIGYRLRWHGAPLRWLTEIVEWDPPQGFADVQLHGPYRLWYHVHRFAPGTGGTRMVYIVSYLLPLGFAGRVLHDLKIRHDLERVFDHRSVQIGSLLGDLPYG